MNILKRTLLVLNGANFLLFLSGAIFSLILVVDSIERFHIEPEDFWGGFLLVFLCLLALVLSMVNVLRFLERLPVSKNRILLVSNAFFVIVFSMLGLSGVLQLVGTQSNELLISLIPATIFFLSLCFLLKGGARVGSNGD